MCHSLTQQALVGKKAGSRFNLDSNKLLGNCEILGNDLTSVFPFSHSYVDNNSTWAPTDLEESEWYSEQWNTLCELNKQTC